MIQLGCERSTAPSGPGTGEEPGPVPERVVTVHWAPLEQVTCTGASLLEGALRIVETAQLGLTVAPTLNREVWLSAAAGIAAPPRRSNPRGDRKAAVSRFLRTADTPSCIRIGIEGRTYRNGAAGYSN